ncbi:MAG: UDP-3-O-(3-hydroxymyristoyl)glucosamine N-acyltransferase [Magnetovibrionaceae bacterium]
MADERFFAKAGPFTLAELAELTGADIHGEADPARSFGDVAPLDKAGPSDFSFLDNPKYKPSFKVSEAGGCVVRPQMVEHAPDGIALLVTKDPYHAYARIAEAFHPTLLPPAMISGAAHIAESAQLGGNCRVEAGVVIGEKVEIGANCIIAANTVIGDGVVIGDGCRIGAGATITHCLMGQNCIIHTGVRIGQDGYGFALGAGGHIKVPQLGRVVIEDDVEIGANTTIDRGAGPDTKVGAGTKIDNLVMIAHNVQIGRNCVIVGQVGISGSTEVGDFVMMGGQAGLAGHLKIGSGAQITARSGLMRDVPPGGKVAGTPALPAREFFRAYSAFEKAGKPPQKD